MFLLDRSKATIDDLRLASQAAREARLDQELSHFEENLEIMLADKNEYLQDLYRRLKQARSTYKSWNRRTAGGGRATQFVSVQQIEELVHWEQITQVKRREKKNIEYPSQNSNQKVDMLIRFLQAFTESKELLNQFENKISKPLFEFFNDDPKRPLTKALAGVVWRWEGLLAPGCINHRLFSPKSTEALYHMATNKPRDTQFNLILRLIPDLALKAFEALCLAKQWRSKLGPWGYTRELKYIHSKWIPETRAACDPHIERFQRRQTEMSLCHDKLHTLQGQTTDVENPLADSSIEIEDSLRKTGTLSRRFADSRQRMDSMKTDVHTTTIRRNKLAREIRRLRDYITMLQEEMKSEQKDIQSLKAQLVQAEIKSQYTEERQMTKMLEDDLKDCIHRCTHLRKEISKADQEYTEQMLKHHSASKWLGSVRTGLVSAKSEQLSVSDKLLKTRDRQERREKTLVAAADNFHLLKEELRTSKLAKQVLLRQMLEPKQELGNMEWTRTMPNL